MSDTKIGELKEIAKKNRITDYFKGSLQELTKVTWPTKNQAVKLTIIVLGFTIVFALFLTLVDFAANKGYLELLNYASNF